MAQCIAIQYNDEITGDYHDYIQLKDGMTIEQFVDEFNHIVNCINEYNAPFEEKTKEYQAKNSECMKRVINAKEKFGNNSKEVIEELKKIEEINKEISSIFDSIIHIDIPFIVTQMGCSYPLGTKQLPEIVLLEDDTLSI